MRSTFPRAISGPLATFPIGGRAELAIGSDLPGRVAENG